VTGWRWIGNADTIDRAVGQWFYFGPATVPIDE
jgi:hypothetical protein